MCRFLLFVVLCNLTLNTSADANTISQLLFNPSAAIHPPNINDQNWETVSLPDDWSKNGRKLAHPAWYAVKINSVSSNEHKLWGLHLKSALTNVQVYVGNEYLGSGGRTSQPYGRNWNRPLYFSIPIKLLKEHKVVYIRLFPKQRAYGGIEPFILGPHNAIYENYQRDFFWKITMSQIVSVILLAISVFYGVLWFHRRYESAFGYFSLSTLCWAIYNMNYFIQNIPIDGKLWDWFAAYSAIGWFIVFICLFFHRQFSIKRPRLEIFILSTTIALDFVMLILPPEYFYSFANYIWDTYLVFLGIYIFSMIIGNSIKRPSLESLFLLFATFILVLFGIHDWYVQLTNASWPHIMHLGAPFFMAMIGWTLLQRFIHALHDVEVLNKDMEERIQLAATELEDTYRKISELEKVKALSNERDRIMRDIHDSVGGQLVSMISMVQNEAIDNKQLIEEIRVTLDDLRLIIESCDPVDSDLLTVLGMLRSRIEHRLIANNIELHWNISEIPKLSDLDPEKVLNILRIVQEAITNVIKHTESKVLKLFTGKTEVYGSQFIFVTVEDEGKGFAENIKSDGRGFNNMKRRALEIGAELKIDPSPSGTSVTLFIPYKGELPVQRKS